MKRFTIVLLVAFFFSCKAQEIPTKIAYKVNATVLNIADKTTFTARNGRIVIEALNNSYRKGDEYSLVVEIVGQEGSILKVKVLKSQESLKQYYRDERESLEILKRQGYRVEDILVTDQ